MNRIAPPEIRRTGEGAIDIASLLRPPDRDRRVLGPLGPASGPC